MIRGRKEGGSYSSWFIGFDHVETFGLEKFPGSELSPQNTSSSSIVPRPISKATSLDKLFYASRDAAFSLPPRPLPGESTPTAAGSRSRQNSVSGSGEFHSLTNRSRSGTSTPVGTQTTPGGLESSVEKRSPTPEITRSLGRSRPRNLEEFRGGRKERDTFGLYQEALDGARRSEEFKFRVKFDQLLVDLHLAVEEKSPNGLSNSFASPSYGEVMLLFRDRVKELLKGFSKRLQLAYDSFSTIEDPDLTSQNVKSDISHFVEDLIGENLELTSDEAVSDLSSVSGDSPHADQTLFEELLAQAIISKLLENHRKEVSKSFNKSEDKGDERVESTGSRNNITVSISSNGSGGRRYISNNRSNGSEDFVDGEQTGSSRFRYRKDSLESLFSSSRSELIPDFDDDDKDDDDDSGKEGDENNKEKKKKFRGGHDTNEDDVFSEVKLKTDEEDDLVNNDNDDNNVDHGTQAIDVNKEFEELREFVRQTQSRPKVEAIVVEEFVEEPEVDEEISQTIVNREEAQKDVDSRFSVLDKVYNYEPPLPDFSQFENIDFASDEIDPDLLSMNLAIIPEETEEELEEEENEDEDEDGRRWRGNWIFKGKDGAPVGKKKLTSARTDHPFQMTVPDAANKFSPRIGSIDADQLSDFSDSEMFDSSDEDRSDEEGFYANTSKELARIRKHHHRRSKGGKKSSLFRNALSDGSGGEENELTNQKKPSLDETEDLPDVPGPIIEVPKQELKLLTDLVPADNDDPRFVVAPESVTVQEGEPVKFTCSVEGTPPIDVFWYREGEEVVELENSEDVELSSDGDKHTAVLYNVGHAMAGQYMCIALSESGKAIQYLVVSVKDNKQELKPPEFLKTLNDVEVTEGQSVKFRVKVKGLPPPRISWYKDGTLLRSSKTCRIEKFGNRDYILTIDYATMDDDAEYTVSARNVAGEIKSTAQVLVEPHSDMPVRKQRLLSDSDSDHATKAATTSTFASSLYQTPPPPTSSPSSSLRMRQEVQQVNQLDRRMAMTQKVVDEESNKMQKDAAKDSPRLLTSIDLELLHTAEEVMQKERTDSENLSKSKDKHLSLNQNTTNKDKLGDLILPDSLDKHHPSLSKVNTQYKRPSSKDSSPQYNDDDFSLMRNRKRTPEKFTSEVSFASVSASPPSSHDVEDISAAVDEILFQTTDSGLAHAEPIQKDEQDVSFDSTTSSMSSSASAKEFIDDALLDPVKHHEQMKNFFSRDFEIHKKPEKKKWSVNLAPFSPKADVINKSLDEDDKAPELGIHIPNDFSPDSSQLSSRGDDNSSQSSPRQSVDSGVYVSRQKEEKPEPVRMFGHTSEVDVPESRTEFNTDDTDLTELPSVNRLRAMFGGSGPSSKSDVKGDGVAKMVHSISARSVNRGRLDKSWAAEENGSSPTGTATPATVAASASPLSTPSTSKLSISSPSLSSSTSSLSGPEVSNDVMVAKSSAGVHMTRPLSPLSPLSSLTSSYSSEATETTVKSSNNYNNNNDNVNSNNKSRASSIGAASSVQLQQQQQRHRGAHRNAQNRRSLPDGVYFDVDQDKEPVLIYPQQNPVSPRGSATELEQMHQRLQKHEPQISSLPKQTQDVQEDLLQATVKQEVNDMPDSLETPRSKTSQPALRSAQPKLVVRQATIEDGNDAAAKTGAPRIRSGCISARAAFWERRMMEGSDNDSDEFPEMVVGGSEKGSE